MFLRSYIPTTLVAAALWAVAATFVGCSNDEVVTTEAAPAAISFTPVLNKANPVTRSVAPLLEDDFEEFRVWAFKTDAGSDNAYVMGKNATTGTLMRRHSPIGNYINNTDDNFWGYAYASDVAFWPNGIQNLQFYALYPSDASGLDLINTMTKDAHGIVYEAEEASDTYDHSMQCDLIAAEKHVALTDIYAKGPTQMNVPLEFKHLLSQVVFEAKLESNVPKFEVIIESITLCNIYKKGLYTFSFGNEEGESKWSFDDYSKTTEAYTIKFAEPKRLYTETGADDDTYVAKALPLTNGTDADNSDNLMLIPQTIIPWKPISNGKDEIEGGVSISGNDADDGPKGAYVKIKCKISQNGVNLLDGDYIYAPLEGVNHYIDDSETSEPIKQDITAEDDEKPWSGIWKAGVKYTYTMTFGLGHNSDGKSNGWPILFSVTASDWDNVASQNVDL